MSDSTNWTPYPEDNFLGLTDSNLINEAEAAGITKAELLIFGFDVDEPISVWLILDIHKHAFGHMYDWAGKWRTTQVTVGQLVPPAPNQVLHLMYQFVDNLNFKLSVATTRQDQLDCLTFAHYEFVRIHPFTNGNGRTGRMLMNLVALKLGYQPLQLYHREGESRKVYINDMKAADRGDFTRLRVLIDEELIPF
ncbi:Fic family protein [Nibrella saemangeumensis]